MLAISPLSIHKDDNRDRGRQNMAPLHDFSIGGEDIEFLDFQDGNLLESIIDFENIFIDGDALPDLDLDPELLAEYSTSGGEESRTCCSFVSVERGFDDCNDSDALLLREEEEGKSSPLSDSNSRRGEEVANDKKDKSGVVNPIVTSKDYGKARKSSSSAVYRSKKSNSPQGVKRKVKVDWTPELHRRFVQAVEQLGVDKAVPSRILEIMGIHCLTRHNIASHLQKYRSHRKHLLAREAEAATWSQRRHMYSSGGKKLRPDVATAANATVTTSPWLAPSATIGLPPSVASPHPLHSHFKPLHVWGHPSLDQSLAYIWPKHLPPHNSPSPPRPLPGWVSAVPPQHAPWHPHQRVTQGTPCYPLPLQPTRFAAPPPFTGYPHHAAVYKVDNRGSSIRMLPGQSTSAPPFDLHPSKETIDAAIGDALTKPWLPLPLGLKPPTLDGVLDELHRHGVPDIPPSSSS